MKSFIIFGWKCTGLALLLSFVASPLLAQNPFSAFAALDRESATNGTLVISLTIPEQHTIYADSIKVIAPEGIKLEPLETPPGTRQYDEFSDAEHDVFTNNVKFIYRALGITTNDLELTVGYQGCSKTLCYLPVSTRFTLAAASTTQADAPVRNNAAAAFSQPESESGTLGGTNLIKGFVISGRQTGYMNPKTFLRFLDDSESGSGVEDNMLQQMLAKNRLWAWLAGILIIVGGFGLNLTPCVLPMIPLNISILGAGARPGFRARGFMLGSVYALAMALAYGILGVVVVLTGSKFGMLNSSPIFNAIIAVIFVALSLAMFDIFTLDFSRFQGSRPLKTVKGHDFLTAFVMGAVAALLAGSCVSPILVSVLLVSSDLFKRGEILGLVLPFLLGIGMGLPWPFLGAGLSFLPSPGKWMINLKRVFGVIILGFAFYYGHLAYRLHQENNPQNQKQAENAQQQNLKQNWLESLPKALDEARQSNKPVFIDFWASWCKNCLAMDETTFQDPLVIKQLDSYVKVKYRAENINDPEVMAMMDYFGSIGLPTYIVLTPAVKQSPQ